MYAPWEGRYREGISPEYSDYAHKSILKKAIELDIRLGCALYGKKYAFWCQDKYLASIKELPDPGETWIIDYDSIYIPSNNAYLGYFKGQNYYLYGRYLEALEVYNSVIDIHPGTYWADESEWQKGMVYFYNGQYADSLSIFSNPQITAKPLFKHRSEYMADLSKKAEIL